MEENGIRTAGDDITQVFRLLPALGRDIMDITIGKTGPVTARIRAPPSKSYTHRALILAALADGISHITGQLSADDTRITARSLAALGVRITWEHDLITVYGTGGRLRAPSDPIDIGDSGTSMRLLTAVCLLADGPVTLTGSERMQERPIGALVNALNRAGASIRYIGREGCPPLVIDGILTGGDIRIDTCISSQFISSLLIASPYAQADSRIILTGPAVSEPYITITTGMMSLFGVNAEQTESLVWSVPAGIRFKPSSYLVEGDYSSSSYWSALAAIAGGTVTITGLNPDSAQGDKRFLEILKDMGCSITWSDAGVHQGENTVIISRTRPLSGVSVDMSDCPDVVQTLAMVAAVARTPTKITGIHHLREKESDRITAIMKGLTTLGGSVTASEDEIYIYPVPLHAGVIHPERDHRTAMSFAILGSVVDGITILDAGCVTKSYPDFWEVLREAWKTGGSS
jgi:3-phosphoshikimate 1-carboxyvinyltransferase